MSVDDAYRVARVLARGTGGVTELVTIEGSGPFVRKKMPREQANRAVWAACADSPCARLPRIEATYELPDAFVVVYDFVPGDSVARLVRSQGPFSAERAVGLAHDVCEATAALHACGIVHRDITPTNVVVASDGAHLVDLGIAHMVVDGATHDDDALGTWGYAAPEQYGFARTDSRSDVYSIGRLLAYMLVGIAPSDEGFDAAAADAGKVPPELRAVIERATAFEPSARYQSAEELAEALAQTESQAGPHATGTDGAAPQEDTPAGKPSMGHRKAVTLVVVLLAAMVVLGIGAFLILRAGRSAGPSGSLAGSGDLDESTSSQGTADASADGDVVQLASLEWGMAANGNVVYLVALSNTSETQAASLPCVTLTGYDSEGGVTFSNDLYFSILRPGETLSMAEFADDAGSTVDIEAQVSMQNHNLTAWDGATGHAFAVDSVSYSRDGSGSSVLSGTVTELSDPAYDGGSMVRVDAVLRDEDGRLVGYAVDYPNRPDVGETTSFQTTAVVDSDDVASYEVYVTPW